MGRADLTKQRLFDTAMKLFARDGFEQTTMRAIAVKAGVATSASYYYYANKESLIHEYYKTLHVDHENALVHFLNEETDFEKRLLHVVRLKIELAEPHKDMARALYRVAANPESSLSPFSEQSKDLRLKALKIFEDVVAGSQNSFHASIKPILPKYLWMYQMAVILHWIYDTSPNSKRTYELINKTVPLIVWFNETLQSTWAAPFRKKIVNVLKNFEPELG